MRSKDPLTDVALRQAKPKAKPYKLADGGGLFLLVTPSGGKWWRFKYRFGGREKLLSFGTYPEVSLQSARKQRDEAREQVAEGIDPGEQRKAEKAKEAEARAIELDTFENVAREWFARASTGWVDSHADKIIRRLERDVFPWIGKRPVREIEAPDVLAVLRRIEERGAIETAHRAQQNCGQVFRYAVATGRCKADPTTALRGSLTPWKPKHYPAILDHRKLAELMRAIDTYEGGLVVRCALRLLPLVFVRPGELRHAEWVEIDLDRAEWIIPAARMKVKTQDYIVPLSRQAVDILKELYPLTGQGRYVFPSNRGASRPMSENTINAALRYLGFAGDQMTGHGFRAIARTILDETLGVRPDIVEHQLGHAVRDPLGRAYNRTSHLAERRKMMQQWADYLDELKQGAKVIPLHRAA